MKIGVFDSGVGGLLVLKALAKELPEYDYVYLGDTQRVPYGNRSRDAVYGFLEEAVEYLFKKDCVLIIVACNTASAEALRKIQRGYLPRHYPERRVLGVIIPTAEAALAGIRGFRTGRRMIGVLATQGTVNAKAYEREIRKIERNVTVVQQAAPLLVPIIENGAMRLAAPALREYLKPLARRKVQAIILGCTHYPVLKRQIAKIAKVPIVSQDEIIPGKLKDYLKRHPEMEERLSKKRGRRLLVTDITPTFQKLARQWFGTKSRLIKVMIA